MASLLRLSPDDVYEPSTAAVLLGWYGGDGMSLLEASLFVSLGIMLLCRVRERSYGKAECLQAEENCKSARRLSEEGFALEGLVTGGLPLRGDPKLLRHRKHVDQGAVDEEVLSMLKNLSLDGLFPVPPVTARSMELG
jgi:hypothetical protein